MRNRLTSSIRALALGHAVAWLPAGAAGAENAAPALPERTQSVVEQLAASRSETLNVGIIAGAGSLAPHCETPDDGTVRSATVAGNIMCIISGSPSQPAGDEPSARTFGEALEGILTGPH